MNERITFSPEYQTLGSHRVSSDSQRSSSKMLVDRLPQTHSRFRVRNHRQKIIPSPVRSRSHAWSSRHLEGNNRRAGRFWRWRGIFPLTWPHLICPFYYRFVLSAVKARHRGIRERTFQSRGRFLASNLLPISRGIRRAFEFRGSEFQSPSISVRRVYRADRESSSVYPPYARPPCMYLHSRRDCASKWGGSYRELLTDENFTAKLRSHGPSVSSKAL